MRYISLFAGIGGFDLALNRLGHQNVYANEWNKYSAQVYENNFKHQPDTTDITRVRADSIPDHDLLVGGFPCQAFSIAGKRQGFGETRGTLFFDIARILEAKKPSYFILENVKGLLNHERGHTFGTIISALNELGYDLQWQVLNSKHFGVPQNRERVYIVGNLREKPRPKVFPIGGSLPENQEQVTTTAIDANYGKGIDDHGQRTMIYWRNSKDKWIKDKRGITPTIKTQGEYTRQPLVMDLKAIGSTTRRGFSKRGYTGALDGDSRQAIDGIRRLTPIECERLQGFPDNWTKFGAMGGGIIEMSDTQRYKQLGNAVTVNVVYEVARRL